MRLFFLGTAAAEGYPGIFCPCEYCRQARALGGRNLRFRSALLVNQDLLIDFGPDLLAAALRFNLSLAGLTTALITHGHSDHFYAGNLWMRANSFTGGLPIPTLDLFAPQDVLAGIEDLAEYRLRTHPVSAFQRWQHRGYTLQTYRAFHAVNHLEAVFYSIADEQHAFLYATDTGTFPAETWAALKGQSFDVIILEETLGDANYDQHLGFDNFLAHVQRMRAEGMLRPGGRVIAHHMSHSGNPPYDQMVEKFAPYGVEVAYDGLEILL